jgi:hypothetical protein
MVRRDLERMSRADSDPFTPRPASRLATLWTLWRRRDLGSSVGLEPIVRIGSQSLLTQRCFAAMKLPRAPTAIKALVPRNTARMPICPPTKPPASGPTT